MHGVGVVAAHSHTAASPTPHAMFQEEQAQRPQPLECLRCMRYRNVFLMITRVDAGLFLFFARFDGVCMCQVFQLLLRFCLLNLGCLFTLGKELGREMKKKLGCVRGCKCTADTSMLSHGLTSAAWSIICCTLSMVVLSIDLSV